MSDFPNLLAKHTSGNLPGQISKRRIFLAFKKHLQILIGQANLHGIRLQVIHSPLVR
jgi:hypothetical protein